MFFEAVLNAGAGERPAVWSSRGGERPAVWSGRGGERPAAGLMVVVVLARHHNVQHVAGVGVLVGLAGVGGGKR